MARLRTSSRAIAAITAVMVVSIGGVVSLFNGTYRVPDDAALAIEYLVQP